MRAAFSERGLRGGATCGIMAAGELCMEKIDKAAFARDCAAHASTGVLAQLTSQLMSYAVSLGASAYFMILASVLNTILAGYNLFKKK